MPTLAYLTPESLEGSETCLKLTLNTTLFRYVLGALYDLTIPSHWELHGAVTPEEASQYFAEMIIGAQSEDCQQMEHRWVRAYRTTDITLPHNTQVPIEWTHVNGSEGQFGFSALTPTLLFPPFPGKYFAFAQVVWEANSTGIRRLRILMDGTVVGASQWAATPVGASSYTTVALLNVSTAGHEVSLQAFQNTGGDLDVHAALGTFGETHLSIFRIF